MTEMIIALKLARDPALDTPAKILTAACERLGCHSSLIDPVTRQRFVELVEEIRRAIREVARPC